MRILRVRRISQVVSLIVLTIASCYIYEKFGLLGIANFTFYAIVVAIVSSVIFGRAYCSWICPFGTLYEFSGIAMKREIPRYHCRVGCPVSLVLGNMNRISLVQVCKDEEVCLKCNTCRKSCPVGVFEIADKADKKAKKGDITPQKLYACIRCLNCVNACPANALKVTLRCGRINDRDNSK